MIADVVRCLRREVPELWSNTDLVRMTSQNITEHVVGVLTGLEYGVEPSEWMRRPPGWKLGQGVILDRLLAEMPRRTKDAESVSAASRLLIAMANGYVDDAAEQGVTAFQKERDRRPSWRLSLSVTRQLAAWGPEGSRLHHRLGGQ